MSTSKADKKPPWKGCVARFRRTSALIDVCIESVAHQGERDHGYEVSVERVVLLARFADLFDPIDLGRLPDLRTFDRTSSAEHGA